MKRFAETTKWEDPWYRKLSPLHKAFFQFLVDRCDNAGVWEFDLATAEFFLGGSINPPEALEAFAGRVVDLGNGKWFIPKFVTFQFGTLGIGSPMHKHILALLSKHALTLNGKGYTIGLPNPRERVSIPTHKNKGYPYPLGKGEGEGTGKGKEEGMQGEKGPPAPPKPFEIFNAYPRHDGQVAALKAIRKACKSISAPDLLAKVEAYATAVRAWPPEDRRYVPWCQKFMNQELWRDDPATWSRKGLQTQMFSGAGPL